MGYDPFWPTSLATVNVLVVPACPLSSEHFDELFQSLKKINVIDLRDVDLEGVNSDLIFSTKPTNGSILFNYSKGLRHSNVQRFPLELNSDPQIILGIYEEAPDAVHSPEHEQGNRRADDVRTALSGLLSRFDHFENGCALLLLALGAETLDAGESVIHLSGVDEEAIYTVLKTAAGALVRNIIALTSKLTDIQLQDPQLLAKPLNGDTPRASQETSHSGVQDRMNGEQQSPDLSRDVIQTTDRQKARYTIALGLLNLLVGSWPDAMRRLSEGAASASESGDQLWHARAVEGLLVCMTLQAWQGSDFHVPEVFDPSKAYAASQLSQRTRSSSISARITAIAQRADVSKLKPFERWFQLAPFVAHLTLDLYFSSQSRDIPQIIITEARIRLINTLIFCQVSGGTDEYFDRFILKTQHAPPHAGPSISRGPDSSLASLLIDLTSSLEVSNDVSDAVEILSAAIGSLAALGCSRKHAFLFRTLLMRLAPAMIRARKLGASEAGIHPTAALSATSNGSGTHEGETTGGLQTLLMVAAAASGISVGDFEKNGPIETSVRLPSDLQTWIDQHATGDLSLKLEILQSCISVCDAMPDMQASLTFISELLRLAIRSPTISATSTNSRPWLTSEGQTQYIDNVKRTTAAARRLGLNSVSAAYWDDFLVRDVQMYQLPNASQLTSHQPTELSLVQDSANDGPRDPFIFNPFAKTASMNATPIVVAGELITFSVLLQNPLEVEIDVSDISLLAEGCDFEATHHSMILGIFCAQVFTLTGIARKSGSLKATGCRAVVEGCHEQDFPIFRDDWLPPIHVKQKPKTVRRLSTEGEPAIDLKIPQGSTFSLRVIDPLPQIELESAHLTQASIMLLEGEKQPFELTIKNTSSSIPADLVLFTYQDNVSSNLQETLGRKDLSFADTYEVQHQLKYRQIIQMTSAEDHSEVPPQKAIRRHFDVFGRPGLLTCAVQVNFAYLGMSRSDIKDIFYTRHARFPISVTVNGSIEILRCNILPVGDDFTFSSNDRASNMKPKSLQDGYCMLSIDLRNVWPQPLSVKMMSQSVDEGNNEDEYTFEDTIQPGHISRAILLVPRIFVQDVYAPIPSLVTQRQFVVSASKLSLEAEAAGRETFWYREALLKQLNGTWKEDKTGRHGEIDLRKGMRMTPRMIDVLKVEHVDISFEIKPDVKASADTADSVKTLGRSHYLVPVESFATLHIRIHNRSKDKLALLLRLQPSLRDQPHNIALDLSRRFAWSGVLQQALHPALEPGDVREAKLGIVSFAAGNYEVNATVEEIKGLRRMAATSVDGIIGNGPERRIWHARMPCLIDAVDL